MLSSFSSDAINLLGPNNNFLKTETNSCFHQFIQLFVVGLDFHLCLLLFWFVFLFSPWELEGCYAFRLSWVGFVCCFFFPASSTRNSRKTVEYTTEQQCKCIVLFCLAFIPLPLVIVLLPHPKAAQNYAPQATVWASLAVIHLMQGPDC